LCSSLVTPVSWFVHIVQPDISLLSTMNNVQEEKEGAPIASKNESTLHTPNQVQVVFNDDDEEEEEDKESPSSPSYSAHESASALSAIQSLLSLAKITFSSSSVSDLPCYKKITKLDLYQCNLSTLPMEMSTLLPNLNILFCMKNSFTEMPAVIGSCRNLEMVSFKSNQLTSIHPEALQSQMRWLILTDNQLTALPSTMSRCIHLQKLMLSGNLLTCLPDSIVYCQQLELIRLASNRLIESPMKLLQQLPRLAWIALSDNPFLLSPTFSDGEKEDSTLDSADSSASATSFSSSLLDESQFYDTGEILGSGASGITKKYIWKQQVLVPTITTTTTTSTSSLCNHFVMSKEEKEKAVVDMEQKIVDVPVAVKTYSSTITSDGNPIQERRIALMTSYKRLALPIIITDTTNISHCPPIQTVKQDTESSSSSSYLNALVHVYGILPSHGSLVMELLQNYTVFAQPPSMQSCTRDVYDVETILLSTIQEAKEMITSLLLVMKHLHSLKISHGDFYGHNILISSPTSRRRSNTSTNEEDTTNNHTKLSVKLTDFGASFLYSNLQKNDLNNDGLIIESIEIRAFGHLLSEIRDMLCNPRNIPPSTGERDIFCQYLQPLIDYCSSHGKTTSFAELLELWKSKMVEL